MAKRARVKDEIEEQDETKEGDLISVETAVAVLSNLSLSVQDCTISDEEKACAFKCAKLSLLEKDGHQARSEYISREMGELLGGDWSCVVGGYGGVSSKSPHIKFRYGEDPIWIMKSDFVTDLPVHVYKCEMEEDMKEDAIWTIKSAFLLHRDRDEVAYHITKEFDMKHKKYWACCICGPEGGSAIGFAEDCFICCKRGELRIELYKYMDKSSRR